MSANSANIWHKFSGVNLQRSNELFYDWPPHHTWLYMLQLYPPYLAVHVATVRCKAATGWEFAKHISVQNQTVATK